MNNKESKLLIWVMLAAGVILALLYSPIGSPENYISSGYMKGVNGVDFAGQFQNVHYAKSINSTQSKSSGNIALNSASLPTANIFDNNGINDENIVSTNSDNATPIKTSQYRVAHQDNSEASNNASYAVQVSDNLFANQSQQNSGGTAITEQSNIFVKNDSRSNRKSTNSDFVAVNLDLTVFSDLNRQGLGPGLNDITDPGEDPTGPPIPVPDGFWLLFGMAMSYVLWIGIIKSKLKKSEN